MAYLIVYKSGETWKASTGKILVTPDEANAFLSYDQRNNPSLSMSIAEVILPPFAAQEAA